MEKSKSCANFQHTCDLLGKRWTLLIIRSLLSGSKRFKEMTDDIDNISHRVLGERLKNLEQDNYVVRHVYPETPVRIEYELTEKGKDLAETITALERWAEKWTH
ncbi:MULTISPECIES: helix-turn-helix domain-containing protein [Bacillaceae]|uniref:winged helix-turn-helix transcriptional regulator n=1 Tax=Bacillaceae TaxID=186817 RepID=UPI0020325B2D|nr:MULTISPECIES: helix-turn-helix domain-containing protein [Bacillaceae]MDX8362423.1 helix-turn-helix domain-containing protein [Cytobacillus sp. IB215316]